jgi:GNAT superfamily N-acetyltransferase
MIAALPGNLTLRSVKNQEDRERFAAFNAAHNNWFEGATSACLLNYHPYMGDHCFWFIEDDRSKQVVSTTCLIPWECNYIGIKLKVAQLEMVLTHPNYRNRGLVRTQINHFHQIVDERQFDVCIIWESLITIANSGMGMHSMGRPLKCCLHRISLILLGIPDPHVISILHKWMTSIC